MLAQNEGKQSMCYRSVQCIHCSKKGPKTTHNKTRDNATSKFIKIADRHPDIDAPEILEALDCSSEHKPSKTFSVSILEGIIKKHKSGTKSESHKNYIY